MNPRVIKPDGFRYLDRVVELCAEQRIYTVIDLHALPGYQNQHWHSDNPTHEALLWKHKDFRDRTVVLWRAIASHYRDEPWAAGYDLINEPADPSGEIDRRAADQGVPRLRSVPQRREAGGSPARPPHPDLGSSVGRVREALRGLVEDEVVELAESFNLDNAGRRTRLEAILSGRER